MAAAAPLVPVLVPAPAPNNPFLDEDPVLLPAGHSLVAATGAFMDWQVAPAAHNPAAHVAVPLYKLLFAFGTRFKVSPIPADQAAARAVNIFRARFNAAFWSRVLSELCTSGLAQPGVAYETVAELHVVISALPLQNPNALNITAVDWDLAPALTSPGNAAAQAGALARFNEISFLAAAPLVSLEISSGPRARTSPWAAITLLAGALGPIGRNFLRLADASPALIMASELRGDSTAQNAVLAAQLKPLLVSSILPAVYRAHAADYAAVGSELQAGLRYRRSEDEKSAIEEERIHYVRSWYPTIARAVVDLGTDEGQIVDALRVLQKAMLPSELHDARLAAVLGQIETQLANRLPTLNHVLAKANVSLSDVTAALIAENAVMTQAGQSAANTIVGRGAPGGGADADGLALAHQSFKNVELALGQFDLTSEAGQRDAITSILAVGDCILAARILLHPFPKTADLASTRNATCIAINGLRPQLYNYFNHVLRLDTSGAAAVIPPHMKRYAFATPTSREDASSLLAQFLRFDLEQMDLFSHPHGAGSWALCVNVGSATEAVSKPNYFVQLSNLERIKGFVNILLVAIGVPQAAPVSPNPALQGYSWPSFVDLYISKLKLAAGLPLLLDQYLHIAACVKIFESALTAMRQRLISLIRDPDPSSRTLQAFLFPPDGSVIQDLISLGTEISRKRTARGDMAGAFKMHEGKAAIANWETLRLDDSFFTDHLKFIAKKARVGDASSSLSFGADFLDHVGESPASAGADSGLPPGSLSKSWRWHKQDLIISGLCWNVPNLAKHLGVPPRGVGAPCWPFILAGCADKNRMARCGISHQTGHESPQATHHAQLAGFDRETLMKLFAKPASPELTADLIRTPEKGSGRGRGEGRGRGAGRGKGERGRGRQGGRARGGAEEPPAETAAVLAPAEMAAVLAELASLKRRMASYDQPDPKLHSPARAQVLALRVRPGSEALPPPRPRVHETPDLSDLDDEQHFEQPPPGEPPVGGLHFRLINNPVPRNFRLSCGDVSDDLAVDAELYQLLFALPTAAMNPLLATNLRELPSPLKTLAATLSVTNKFIVDCGGQGQCGPNTLGYLLGLVDRATVDGPQLRQAVVKHALTRSHRSRPTRFRDRQGRFYTLEGLILRCLSDDLGSSPDAMMQTVEGWCSSIAKPTSWTDLAFLQVAADCYNVAIYIHTVDDLSNVGNLGAILPCASTSPPVALLEVGMWVGRHLVAVVTSDLSANACPAPLSGGVTPHPGSVRAIGRDEEPFAHEQVLAVGRGARGGNPFPVSALQDAARVAAGFRRLLCCAPTTTAGKIAAELNLHVAPGYTSLRAGELQSFVDELAQNVHAGARLALQCPGCREPLHPDRCHGAVLASAIAEQVASPPMRPLTLEEVQSLLSAEDAPTVLVGCEFSGALTRALQTAGFSTLSCDFRPALHRFPHYLGDVRDVVGLRHWERAYFFPSCFQHLRGDEQCLPFKIDDCRAFWAAAMVLWCLSCPNARVVVVEQPDTIVYDYIDVTGFASLCEFRTSQYGDPGQHDKFVRLAIRNAQLPPALHPERRQAQRLSHLEYPDPDARDRARSSWAPHRNTCQALVNLQIAGGESEGGEPDGVEDDTAVAPSYVALIMLFAANWFCSGHPVPTDYLNQDARPTGSEWRLYQEVRGSGDGRRPPLTEPLQAPYGDCGGDDGSGQYGHDGLKRFQPCAPTTIEYHTQHGKRPRLHLTGTPPSC